MRHIFLIIGLTARGWVCPYCNAEPSSVDNGIAIHTCPVIGKTIAWVHEPKE